MDMGENVWWVAALDRGEEVANQDQVANWEVANQYNRIGDVGQMNWDGVGQMNWHGWDAARDRGEEVVNQVIHQDQEANWEVANQYHGFGPINWDGGGQMNWHGWDAARDRGEEVVNQVINQDQEANWEVANQYHGFGPINWDGADQMNRYGIGQMNWHGWDRAEEVANQYHGFGPINWDEWVAAPDRGEEANYDHVANWEVANQNHRIHGMGLVHRPGWVQVRGGGIEEYVANGGDAIQDMQEDLGNLDAVQDMEDTEDAVILCSDEEEMIKYYFQQGIGARYVDLLRNPNNAANRGRGQDYLEQLEEPVMAFLNMVKPELKNPLEFFVPRIRCGTYGETTKKEDVLGSKADRAIAREKAHVDVLVQAREEFGSKTDRALTLAAAYRD